MESPPRGESPKLADMVMCGDHPSVTKTELNAKEMRSGDKGKTKVPSCPSRITPTSSRSERPQARAMSELMLRPEPRADLLPANKALVYAALGSFRWPPYLLCVWVLVLVMTHALHAVVAVLDNTLPPLRKLCVYFRCWTEDSWKIEVDLNRKMFPLALGGTTVLLYALYSALYALHALALWAAEPLCGEPDDQQTTVDISKVTDYIEDVSSKTNFALKH